MSVGLPRSKFGGQRHLLAGTGHRSGDPSPCHSQAREPSSPTGPCAATTESHLLGSPGCLSLVVARAVPRRLTEDREPHLPRALHVPTGDRLPAPSPVHLSHVLEVVAVSPCHRTGELLSAEAALFLSVPLTPSNVSDAGHNSVIRNKGQTNTAWLSPVWAPGAVRTAGTSWTTCVFRRDWRGGAAVKETRHRKGSAP